MKDGAIVERIGWTETPSYSRHLSETGSYYIQAHLKRGESNTLKRSESLFFGTESELEELKDLLKKSTTQPRTLPLYSLIKPFEAFLFAQTKSFSTIVNPEKIDSNLKSIYCEKTNASHIEIYGNYAPCKHEEILHFSGTSICDSNFIFGSEDITDSCNTNSLLEAIGNFTLISKQDSEIKISTDYFGFSKIYYYHSDNEFFASNSYHLLILALHAANIALEIDYEVALSKLNFVGLQPFYQNFSRKMDIKGVYCLPVDKMFSITETGVTIQDKAITRNLSNDREPSEDEYNALLAKAKNEILSNFSCIARSPRFDDIIVDVSGGMDSRLVFCAITNFPQHRKKVSINSQDTRGAPNELNVALSINSCYGYPYDESQETILVPCPQTLNDNISSYYLGTYYSYNFPQTKTIDNKSMRLTGFGGEIVARPYYSRMLLNSNLDVQNTEDFVELYFEKYGYLSLFGRESKFYKTTKSLFKEELELIPGSNALEKFDLHYLYYRNGLHCSDSWRVDISGAEFAILQSKAFFELKIRCFNQHKSIKLQLDMMSCLNPVIAKYPYESDMDNDSKAALESILKQEPGYIQNLNPEISSDRASWADAQKNKRSKRQVVSDDYPTYKAEFQDFLNNRLQLLASALATICASNEQLIEDFAAPIYYFAKNNFKGSDSGTHFQNLYTKVLSLAHQVTLIEKK